MTQSIQLGGAVKPWCVFDDLGKEESAEQVGKSYRNIN
jgi:hypothetical protein